MKFFKIVVALVADSSTSETLNVDRQHHRDSYDSLAYVSISPRDDYTGIPTDGVSMPVVHTAVISDAVKDTGELSGVSDDLHAHIGYDSTSYTSDVVSPASTLLSQNVLHSSDQEPTWNEQVLYVHFNAFCYNVALTFHPTINFIISLDLQQSSYLNNFIT